MLLSLVDYLLLYLSHILTMYIVCFTFYWRGIKLSSRWCMEPPSTTTSQHFFWAKAPHIGQSTITFQGWAFQSRHQQQPNKFLKIWEKPSIPQSKSVNIGKRKSNIQPSIPRSQVLEGWKKPSIKPNIHTSIRQL